VHQHRRLGVPVRLGAHVDAGHDHVDLAAVLGEPDDPPQRGAHPVHVLRPGLHRDPGARGEGEPFHRDAALFGQVERGDDPPALRLGDRPQPAGGVAAEHDPGEPFRVQRRRGGDQTADDAGLVEPRSPVHRHQGPGLVEVEFLHRPAPSGEHVTQLVGVHQPATAGAQHLRRVLVQRLQRFGRRTFDGRGDPRPRVVVEADGAGDDAAAGGGEPAMGQHLFDAGALAERGDLGLQRRDVAQVDVDHRPDVHPHVVHVQLLALAAAGRADPADRLQAVLHRPLGVRESDHPAVRVPDGGDLPHLGHRHQPPVGRIGLGHAVEQQDVLGGGQAGGVEIAEPPQVEPAAHHRVDSADAGVLGQHARPPVGEVIHRFARLGTQRDHDPAGVPGPGRLREPRLQAFGRLRRAGGVRPGDVQLDHRLLAGAAVGQQLGDRCSQRLAGIRAVQFGAVGQRGDHPGRASLQPVVADRGGASGHVQPAQVLQPVVGVVTAEQHLEHRLVRRDPVAHPLSQVTGDLFGDGGQRRDPGVPVGGVRVGGQGGHLGAHAGEHLGPLTVDLRLVEPAEPDAAGHVADHREAALGGADQALQMSPGHRGQRLLRRGFGDPAVQDAGDQLHVRGEPLLGQEHPEDGRVQQRGAAQIVHAVVRQGARETASEFIRKPGAFHVQALQVAVEVLPIAVHPQFAALLGAGRTVPAQLGDVGEQAHQVDLPGEDVTARGADLVPRGHIVGEQRLAPGRVEVVAEQNRGQRRASLGRPGRGVRALGRTRESQSGDQPGSVRRLGGLVVADLLQTHQRGAGLDLTPGDDEQFLDPPGEGRRQDGLHLHRLQHQHRVAGGHQVADVHRGRDHQRRGRGPQDAALVPADPVGDPLDLDQVDGTVLGGHQPEPPTADRQPGVERVQSLQVHRDRLLLATGGHGHLEALRTGPDRGHLINRAAQLEVDRTAGLVLHLGTPAVGGLQQARDLDGLLVGVRLDRRGDQRHPGVPVVHQTSLGADAVDPAGVCPTAGGLTGDHRRLVQQVEDEALVRRAAFDHDGGLGHRPAQASQRLVAVASHGDDLGDHRVEVGRNLVALGDPGVHPDPGSRGQVEPLDASRGGGEIAVGILGVEPGLDRMADLDRLVASQPTARRDVQLRLDQIHVGGRFGDRVLHLQPGVHL